MVTIKIRNHEITYSKVKDSFQRRMVQFENKIREELKKIGVTYDYIAEFQHPRLAIAPKEALLEWGFGSSSCHLTVNKESRYIDNLNIMFQLLKKEVADVLSGELSPHEFEFKYAENNTEEESVDDKRKWAREFLELETDCMDMKEVNKAYKKFARIYHPDMSNGCQETFANVNEAHKILKKELE